jgi:hypothetical protein
MDAAMRACVRAVPTDAVIKMRRGRITESRRCRLMASDMNSKTIGAVVVYCDWLQHKGYATASQVGPWKIAIRKVFEGVDGPEFEDVALDGLDLDDAFRRFRTLTAQTYKSESQDAYVARVRRALEAYEYWVTNGRPPVFRQVGKKSDDGDAAKPKSAGKAKAKVLPEDRTEVSLKRHTPENPEFIDYPFPLRNGQIARLSLPPRLEKQDVDRMVQLLHALQFEPQPQIPERTGEQVAA